MNSLLLASDLSSQAEAALERASVLAAQNQSDLSILHVIDRALPSSIISTLKDQVERHLRENVELQCSAVSKPIKMEIRVGKKSVEIIEYARKTGCNLIVLGSHNEIFEDFFQGTTIEQIIRLGEFPVLVVKSKPLKAYEKVVIAVDFSIQSRKAMEQAVGLCPHAEFHLVHAYEPQFKDFTLGENLRDRIEENNEIRFERLIDNEMSSVLQALHMEEGRVNKVIRQGNVDEVLRNAVEQYNPDLLALGTHGRSGIAHALIGSVTEKILKSPPCDILTVKAW